MHFRGDASSSVDFNYVDQLADLRLLGKLKGNIIGNKLRSKSHAFASKKSDRLLKFVIQLFYNSSKSIWPWTCDRGSG